MLNSVKKLLKKYYDTVDAVENGKEALQAVLDRPLPYYQAIVLDIDMPVMCGDEACREILMYFRREVELLQRECSGQLSAD